MIFLTQLEEAFLAFEIEPRHIKVILSLRFLSQRYIKIFCQAVFSWFLTKILQIYVPLNVERTYPGISKVIMLLLGWWTVCALARVECYLHIGELIAVVVSLYVELPLIFFKYAITVFNLFLEELYLVRVSFRRRLKSGRVFWIGAWTKINFHFARIARSIVDFKLSKPWVDIGSREVGSNQSEIEVQASLKRVEVLLWGSIVMVLQVTGDCGIFIQNETFHRDKCHYCTKQRVHNGANTAQSGGVWGLRGVVNGHGFPVDVDVFQGSTPTFIGAAALGDKLIQFGVLIA